MKIKREKFLADLMMVRAGLSARESLEQSSSFAFVGKEVMTFNDEVACRKGISISINGAIEAAKLLEMLEKIPDPYLKVREEDNELLFRGKRKGWASIKDSVISLPIDRVERPKTWEELPDEFSVAVESVKASVGTDETKFILTCVHITGDFVESCNNNEIMRYRLKMPMVDESVLVRGDAISQICDLKMTAISLSKSWIHFRNEDGLIYSARRYMEDYPDLAPLLKVKGKDIVLPKRLAEASDRAAIYAGDAGGDPIIVISLAPGIIRVKGRGGEGRYWEAKKINYSGPEMEFQIRPSQLRFICERYTDAVISNTKMKVTGGAAKDGGLWEYVTVLGIEEEETDKKPKRSKAEEDQDADK